MQSQVFANFADFWRFGKHLTEKQRHTILRSLPPVQREAIENSYQNDGWHDLTLRNQLDGFLREIEVKHGWNLLDVRLKVLNGRTVYVKRKFWEEVNKRFKGYEARHIFYIFGGYRVVESEFGRDEYRLVPVEEK
jgi:hypothetical protein